MRGEPPSDKVVMETTQFKTKFVEDQESVMVIDNSMLVKEIRFHQQSRQITIVFDKIPKKESVNKKKVKHETKKI